MPFEHTLETAIATFAFGSLHGAARAHPQTYEQVQCSMKPDFTKIRLFKYLSAEGAKKTLSTGGLKLSQPSSFNDPFDMRIDEILGLDFKQFAEQQKLVLVELLEALDVTTLRASEMGHKAALLKEALRRASPDQKKHPFASLAGAYGVNTPLHFPPHSACCAFASDNLRVAGRVSLASQRWP